MTEADGCIGVPFAYADLDDTILPPIRYGEEEDRALVIQLGAEGAAEFKKQYPARERCPDCHAKKGEYHHPSCDVEECPRCHMQAISCACVLRE